MHTISSVGGAGSAWPDLTSTQASARTDRMFAKADANGDGTVDTTELQNMLDNIASKTGQSPGNAASLMSQLDTDGSGSLSKDEFAAGMKSLLPPPSSTMDFAQQRSADGTSGTGTGTGTTTTTTTTGSTAAANDLFSQLDTDNSGGLNSAELNKLLDQIAAGQSATATTTTGSTASTGSTSSTDSVAAAADAAVFKQLDTNGDGTISKSEFDAAVSGKVEGHHHHGHRPPPVDSSSSSSDGTGTGTGTTNAGAAAAGPLASGASGGTSATDPVTAQFQQLITNLSSALDGTGTGNLSASQGDAFTSQFDSMIAALESTGSTAASSGNASTGSNAASTSGQGNGPDLSALASLVMKEYSQAAANYAQTASVSVAA